jgi:hypothetical protein
MPRGERLREQASAPAAEPAFSDPARKAIARAADVERRYAADQSDAGDRTVDLMPELSDGEASQLYRAAWFEGAST